MIYSGGRSSWLLPTPDLTSPEAPREADHLFQGWPQMVPCPSGGCACYAAKDFFMSTLEFGM